MIYQDGFDGGCAFRALLYPGANLLPGTVLDSTGTALEYNQSVRTRESTSLLYEALP